jgi:hypothetical protein
MTCKNLTFEECELAILRSSVDKIEKIQGKELVELDDTKKMISIVKSFIKNNKCILYGGTAINDVLPKNVQFYNYEYQFPDYDMFTPNAMELAKTLADLFKEKGFYEIEAKAGVHFGTYKVFVNQLPVADITHLHKELYDAMWKRGKKINGLMYAPINFLKQACYLELSRPRGDIDRWEKVYKRLTLLNKYYPLDYDCKKMMFDTTCENTPILCSDAMDIVKQILYHDDVVFIGEHANDFYIKNVPDLPKLPNLHQYSVISTKAVSTCKKLMKALHKWSPVLKTHKPIGELILDHYAIMIGNVPVCYVFTPVACHSYNVIKHSGVNIKIASIDTLFSYYLAFIYSSRNYLDEQQILCLCSTLFHLQEKNRITNKGIFRRFNINCYGTQKQLKDIRAEKNKMFDTLKPGTKQYNEWFLKYVPKTRKLKQQTSKTRKTNIKNSKQK